MGDELEYKHADSIFKKERIKDFIADDLMPTERMNYILIGIFVLVIILGFVQFPIGSFLTGNIDGLSISVGYPLGFFELRLDSGFDNPFKFLPLLVDMIIYSLFSYLIDILITALRKAFMRSNNLEENKKARIFGNRIDREVVEI